MPKRASESTKDYDPIVQGQFAKAKVDGWTPISLIARIMQTTKHGHLWTKRRLHPNRGQPEKEMMLEKQSNFNR